MPCGMFCGTPGLSPLRARRSSPAMVTKHVPRHCRCPFGEKMAPARWSGLLCFVCLKRSTSLKSTHQTLGFGLMVYAVVYDLCNDILVLIQNSDQKTRKEDHGDFFFGRS